MNPKKFSSESKLMDKYLLYYSKQLFLRVLIQKNLFLLKTLD